MVLAQNKKKNYFFSYFFIILAVAGSLFFLTSSGVYAADGESSSMIGTAFSNAFKWILYGIFVAIGWLVSAALTLFEWSIDPSYISGSKSFFNAASTYEMWKFIRDFFNLFFILALLYLAFTTIFQVAKDYKKALLNLVIMALLVNFSFPISRFLIDVANVPMYFFANQIFSGTAKPGQDALSSVLSASKLENVLLVKEGSGDSAKFDPSHNDFSRLIMAIVFMFIFAITLLVLAVMFVIRLIALVVLVIFSSVGFVGSLFPFLGKISTDWWKNFLNYAFYGPAAMLMLLIATRFFVEIGKDSTFQSMKAVSSGITQDSSMSTFIGSMAMFSIPIVMLWIAIGLAGRFSMIGAGTVTGWGEGFIKSTGKKMGNGAKWITYQNPVARGVGEGMKKNIDQGKMFGFKYGKDTGMRQLLTGKFWKAPSGTEARVKGLVSGGVGGMKTEVQKLRDKQINEKVDEHKKNKMSNSALIKDLESKNDPVTRAAAALALAENKGITDSEVLHKALDATGGDMEKSAKILEAAKEDAFDFKDNNKFKEFLQNAAFAEIDPKTNQPKKDATGNFILDEKSKSFGSLKEKMKKEGHLKVLVEFEKGKNTAAGMSADAGSQAAFSTVLGKLSADDLAKQGSLHDSLATDDSLKDYLKERVKDDSNYYQEAMKKMTKEDRDKWNTSGVIPKSDGGTKSSSSDYVREKMKQARAENRR